MHRWISSFLSDRTQEVVIENKSSESSPVTSGVPQGSVLGPLLFLLFINELPTYATNSSHVPLFADDALIYRPIDRHADCDLLQEDLDGLLRWEKEWGMVFHPGKCEVMSISKKKVPILNHYSIRGTDLLRTDKVTYLGVTISKDGSWNEHIQATATAAHNKLSFLQRNLYRCTQEIKDLSYKTLVRTKLEYACSVWNPYTAKNTNKLESVQKKAARFVCSDKAALLKCSLVSTGSPFRPGGNLPN